MTNILTKLITEHYDVFFYGILPYLCVSDLLSLHLVSRFCAVGVIDSFKESEGGEVKIAFKGYSILLTPVAQEIHDESVGKVHGKVMIKAFVSGKEWKVFEAYDDGPEWVSRVKMTIVKSKVPGVEWVLIDTVNRKRFLEATPRNYFCSQQSYDEGWRRTEGYPMPCFIAADSYFTALTSSMCRRSYSKFEKGFAVPPPTTPPTPRSTTSTSSNSDRPSAH